MIKKAVSIYLLGFLVFTAIGYYDYNPNRGWSSSASRFSDSDFEGAFAKWENSNYASAKGLALMAEMEQVSSANNVSPELTPMLNEQKFEKVASMGAVSTDYESTVDSIMASVKSFEAIIQYEENSGLVGERSIRLAIGVEPEKFEEAVLVFKGIGTLEYFRSDVRDKTNQYRELQAKRKTLELHLQSLKEFKQRDGEINDLMGLQTKILGVQEELQSLGVNLGDFSSENEFCTIKLNVKERVEGLETEKVYARMLHAFTWAVEYYWYFTLSILFFCGAFYLVIQIFRVLKKMLQLKHTHKEDK